MKDFIQNLYSNPNFPLYLGIVIIVLLITFFVVYMLGKKDKERLEETKKLDTVENNAFSEVSMPTSVETPKVEPVVTQENVPVTNEAVKEEIKPVIPEQPMIEPIKEEVVAPVINEEPIINTPEVKKVEPVIEKTVEPEVKVEQPAIPDIIQLPDEEEGYKAAQAKYEEITENIDKDLNELENKMVKPVLNETIEPPISMPTVENVEEVKPTEVKKTEVVNEVFSSVYAPKKDPIMFDETEEIELPRLK